MGGTFGLLADIDDQIEEDNNLTLEHNASKEIISSMDDIPGWIPVIIIVAIGTVLIGLISKIQS